MAEAKSASAEPHAASEKEVHSALADLGPESPRALRVLAEDLPEKDEVQKAIKKAMLADDMAVAAKEKAKVVDASPDAADTPSGYALKKVAGISHDADRGEAYLRHKTAKRWGYVPAEES